MPVPRRWSQEWFQFVRQTGRWDLPRTHRTRAFADLSPWSRRLINAMFERLRRVFPPAVGKRVFNDPASSPSLYSLLLFMSAPANSNLLRIGLDLCCVGQTRSDFSDRLATEESHWGARFELRFLAAARLAGIRHVFEPSRGDGAGGPDLRLELEQPVFAELKAPLESKAWQQRDQTYRTIVLGGHDASGMADLMYMDLSFTDRFRQLDATDEGRYHLAQIADRLGRSAAEAARSLSGRKSIVVDGLLRLNRPNGRLGRPEPLVPDCESEAERVVQGVVLDACSQLPSDRPGLIVVETEKSWAPLHELCRRTTAWFDDAVGRQYPHVAGVLYTYRMWWSTFPCVSVVPVWRSTVPRWLVQSKRLRDLECGLRWADVCAWDWRRNRKRTVT